MAKKWKVQKISKEDMQNDTLSTKVEKELNRLSEEGWSVHTILDNYSVDSSSRNHVAIFCWKDE